MAESQRPVLSPNNPWPGLDPFGEADRDYFHGRAAESGELVRLVRRELLTVLFGRSGLGKTSLLKAGLFPLLRDEGYLPAYVRLDHADGAPPLREQVFRELRAACEARRVQAAQPTTDESLWSFFHRREAEFWSALNRPVTPVIVFDQFEEIFTLGQETEGSRARSAAFLSELGDLVENRPSDAVRQALETDPTAARRFDFKRSNVKLVLSFREDFLAEMEGLKERMPSLMYNRFRLLAMNGAQAYDVIIRAGRSLVDDGIARRIIRLAWKNEPSPPVDRSEFPKIEIDPALLSVVCSELNLKRQQARPPLDRITPALLEGADREILADFYERGIAGLDPSVRVLVEDELITDDGRYRNSHSLADALALPGITSEALDALIRRRLLRMDERQSVRRLELTHDVLTRVVKESRDSRRAREAEEAAVAREQAAREQQQRNRRNAALVLAGAVVVIVLAVLAGWFAWKTAKLVRDAEITRLMETADRLEDTDYDVSLLVNMEAARGALTLDASIELLRRLNRPHPAAALSVHQGAATSVAFSPDGKRLAASTDKTVILWDLESGQSLATLEGHEGTVQGVAFSPDGKRLASASADETVILWDVDSRQPLATLERHKATVNDVAFSPDGKRLASASGDKTVIVWDMDSRQPLATLEGHEGTVWGVAFSPDGKRLASASTDETAILWDLDSHKPLAKLEGQGTVNDVAFSPDGKRLASASEDQTVILWEVASGQPLATLEGHKGTVWGVAFSSDGKRLASASDDKTVILWEVDKVDSGQPLATLEGHKGTVQGGAFSPDGKRLASASDDKTVILWDVNSRKPLATLEGHKGEVYDVAFSPDGKLLASASTDQTVILWDLDSRKSLAMLEGHKFPVTDVAFSLDGKLASASWDETVILWDLDSGQPLARLEGHKGAVNGVAFSPDGKLLASASEGTTVILWDVDSRKPLASLERHKAPVTDVAFSPDGRRLASASRDQTVILWDVDSRRLLAKLEGYREVSGVAFSPDGKRLALASYDETVILWDVDSRKRLATLEGHTDMVSSVAFSPDENRLASASWDRTVNLWNLDLSTVMADACRTANRNLTCEEWRSYIGAEKPYRKACPTLPGPEKCD